MRGAVKDKTLTRADIRTFDNDAKAVVLEAMRLGGTGRITREGHAFIKGPNGATMSVARDSSAPNCKKNLEAELRRCFGTTTTEPTKEDPMHDDKRYVPFSDIQLPTATNGNGTATTVTEALIECPVKGCDREFATLDGLYGHAGNDHAICRWPGCDMGPSGRMFIGSNGSSIAGHTNIHHKGNRPWEHRDPASRSAAAKKTAATKAAKRTVAVPETQERNAKPVPVVITDNDSRPDSRPEHRALPTEASRKLTDKQKLAEIQKLLGADPHEVMVLKAENAKLQAKVNDLQAQLDMVAEVLHIDVHAQKK